MCQPSPPQRRCRTFLAWLWAISLALWTAALLTSVPVQASHQLLPPSAGWPLSKLLHLAAYAFLTALLGWLRFPPAGRWSLLACLCLHACATEWLQRYVPLRTGSVQDVLIDHAGILLGAVFSYRAWTAGD